MRTKENYRGEKFDVTYDKLFYTSDGMGFVLKREEDIDSRMMEVFGTDIHIHLANVGCAIFFKNEPRNENADISVCSFAIILQSPCKVQKVTIPLIVVGIISPLVIIS